ncbi:MAG: NYN domain-containing protein [Candidatus Thorarchaeota archaeon]
MSRAAVLIDLGFFSKVLKFCFGEPRVDFEKLSETLCEGRERFRTYVYDCMPYQSNPPTQQERERYGKVDSFMNHLRKLNRFQIRLGRLQYIPQRTPPFMQKRVDVHLAVDLVRMSWGKQIDTAVLVGGDSDYVPAVMAAKDAGVLTILYYRMCYDKNGKLKAKASDELMAACDECREIDQNLIDKVTI